MRKYNWYKLSNYTDKEERAMRKNSVSSILKKYGIHPNDFKTYGKYLIRLSDFSVQVEEERLKWLKSLENNN